MFRCNRWWWVKTSLLGASMVGAILVAQQPQKPLTDQGVIQLIQAGLPESVIIAAIQSSPASYDVSTDALIKLNQAGATPNEMTAIITAQQGGNKAGAPSASARAGAGGDPAPASSASQPRWEMPSVAVLTQRSADVLPLEKAQLEQSKIKMHSLASMAGDSALTQGIQSGVSDAAWDTAVHMNSGIGGAALIQSGGIVNGILGRRSQTTTYVWGIPGCGFIECIAHGYTEIWRELRQGSGSKC